MLGRRAGPELDLKVFRLLETEGVGGVGGVGGVRGVSG